MKLIELKFSYVFNQNEFNQINDSLIKASLRLFDTYSKIEFKNKLNSILNCAEKVFIDSNGFLYYTNINQDNIRLFNRFEPISIEYNTHLYLVNINQNIVTIYNNLLIDSTNATNLSNGNINLAFF